jgi:hypothetical protein
MSDNVRPIFGGKFAAASEPVPQVVAFIERLLERAKAGDVRAIAVAYIRSNGHPADGWDRDADPDLVYRLHSAIACLMGGFTDDVNSSSVVISARDDDKPEDAG